MFLLVYTQTKKAASTTKAQPLRTVILFGIHYCSWNVSLAVQTAWIKLPVIKSNFFPAPAEILLRVTGLIRCLLARTAS